MNAEINQMRANLGLGPFVAQLELVPEDDEDRITDVNIRCDDVKVYQYALERERARHAQTRVDCDAETARAERHKGNARHLRDEVRELVEECRTLETQRNVLLVLSGIAVFLAVAFTAVML